MPIDSYMNHPDGSVLFHDAGQPVVRLPGDHPLARQKMNQIDMMRAAQPQPFGGAPPPPMAQPAAPLFSNAQPVPLPMPPAATQPAPTLPVPPPGPIPAATLPMRQPGPPMPPPAMPAPPVMPLPTTMGAPPPMPPSRVPPTFAQYAQPKPPISYR